MYTAFDQETGTEILILRSAWKERLIELRKLDKVDRLVCPGCRKPVRVRAGRYRRWHFAHKHLVNCPYARISPAHLEARAQLYDWLVVQFDESSVSVEKVLPNLPLPGPIDCWVDLQVRSVAYWIIENRLSPDVRQSLKAGLDQSGAQVVIIFLADMLHEEPMSLERVYLTTTEREFMAATSFDPTYRSRSSEAGTSLYYLDLQGGELVAFRNLRLFHRPQLFEGRRLAEPLARLTVDHNSGHFIFPGEAERVRRWKAGQEAFQQRQQEASAALAFFSRHARQQAPAGESLASAPSSMPSEPAVSPESPQPFTRQATCRVCGKLTQDWLTYFGKSGECICRACGERRDS